MGEKVQVQVQVQAQVSSSKTLELVVDGSGVKKLAVGSGRKEFKVQGLWF